MAQSSIWRQPDASPAADRDALETALIAIEEADLAGLRSIWRARNKSEPTKSLSRDLLARVLAHQIQEDALSGLEPRIVKLLDRLAADKESAEKQIKPGSLIVREYQGVVHEVIVAPGGFFWREALYPSLSAIAKEITGTKWNGPRFFGLRMNKGGNKVGNASANDVQSEGQNRTAHSAKHNRGQGGNA
jgi:hypothetical protein